MAKRIAYFDCFSGASGDMLLGALLDAGLELAELQADLQCLDLKGYELVLTPQVRQGVSGSKFDVLDHDHGRPAHNLSAVRAIIEQSALSPEVIATSLNVFAQLAKAEAHVHGITADAVHFHELGAVDSLVDIVGFCCAVRRLGIEALYASPLPTGSGTVHTEHGLLPVPAPATLVILAEANAPLIPCDARGEMVTPTGAALLATLATFSQPPLRVQRVGYGFGTQEFPWPNAVRVWVGDELSSVNRAPNPQPYVCTEQTLIHTHQQAHEHLHPHGHDHDPGNTAEKGDHPKPPLIMSRPHDLNPLSPQHLADDPVGDPSRGAELG